MGLLLRRRRPLLRAAAVGGGAYYMGKHRAGQEQQAQEPPPEQQYQQPPPGPAQPAGDGGLSDDAVARLEQLGKLHEQGVLTDEEFAQQKAKLLGS